MQICRSAGRADGGNEFSNTLYRDKHDVVRSDFTEEDIGCIRQGGDLTVKTCCTARLIYCDFCLFASDQCRVGFPTEKELRGQDLNLRPSGYEPDELPDCSTPLCL